jgi:hypothetical protein
MRVVTDKMKMRGGRKESPLEHVMRTGDRKHDVGGNGFPAKWGEDQKAFLKRWKRSPDAWATYTFILHTAGVLLERHVGLVILDTRRPVMLMTYMAFYTEPDVPSAWKKTTWVSHLLFLAYNGHHYETVAFPCPWSSDLTALPEVLAMSSSSSLITEIVPPPFHPRGVSRGLCSRPVLHLMRNSPGWR